MVMKPVTVSLHDLQTNNIPHATLLEAFGPNSLGILIVSDLPSSFPSLRNKVLTNASRLAALPPSSLEALTKSEAKYLVGWSHGKETLRPGVVDTFKGSYYINCSFYNTDNPSKVVEEDTKTWPGFEEYTAPSVWPESQDIPQFQEDTETLIRLIIDTAVLVARQCDRFAEKEIPEYESRYLERMVRSSRTTKGRLLHYFPSNHNRPKEFNGVTASNGTNGTSNSDEDKSGADLDTWCSTHLDHGCLTGLTSAQYVDESLPSISSPSLVELPSSPSPTAGLYILDRSGQTHKVAIPRDCLAFQTGEALELITQGKFKAVPHFVRGIDAQDGPEGGLGQVARNTLAVFTQPNLGEVVDAKTGLTFGEFARGVVKKNTAG